MNHRKSILRFTKFALILHLSASGGELLPAKMRKPLLPQFCRCLGFRQLGWKNPITILKGEKKTTTMKKKEKRGVEGGCGLRDFNS